MIHYTNQNGREGIKSLPFEKWAQGRTLCLFFVYLEKLSIR
jgi:hypothetical protein